MGSCDRTAYFIWSKTCLPTSRIQRRGYGILPRNSTSGAPWPRQLNVREDSIETDNSIYLSIPDKSSEADVEVEVEVDVDVDVEVSVPVMFFLS